MFIELSAEDESGLWSWMIEIYEPNSTDRLFFRISGEGEPPSKLVWDGHSNITGELVQSASDYPCSFTATDTLGNVSTIQGVIQVDILVIREGEQLRVQVPSIVFGSNSGGFEGLAPEVIANNEFILTRIAEVLNKFDAYKISVEGHTNPLTRAERDRPSAADRKLSEQRAKTVVDHLVDLGVDRVRLSAFGIAGARPIIALEDKENWWKNRRVEFILIK
jgi:outer membrane protein OmpA-like peptidoglycan-associated protein